MAKRDKDTSSKSSTGRGGRGSPEAIAKRQIARRLNALYTQGASAAESSDGRTENRRRRLIAELKKGRGGKRLKAMEIVAHTDALLALGETLASLRAAGVKPLDVKVPPEDRPIVERAQRAFDVRPEAWRMIGVAPPARNGR